MFVGDGEDPLAGVAAALDARQSRVDQPDDRCLVPLDNNIGDPDLSENAEDVWRDIANSHGVGGVGLKGDPHNNRTNSFVLPRRHPLLFR